MSDIQEKFAASAIEYAEQKVPFRHRGIDRRGCDCTGLLIAIARENGWLKNYKLREYNMQWNLHHGASDQIIEELERFADPIDNGMATVGDIAVMRFGKCPAHCGIIVTKGLVFVHCMKERGKGRLSGGCKKSVLKNSMWSRRWIATYRIDEKKLRCFH